MWSSLWQIFVIIWSKRLLDPVQYIKQHSIMAGIWTTHTQDNSYPRQLVPRTTRTQDKSYPGQLVPKTTRTHDNSYTRQLVPRSTRTHVVWYHIYHISYLIYHIISHISYIVSYHITTEAYICHCFMRYYLDLVKIIARYEMIIAWYETIKPWYAIIITLYAILQRNNARFITKSDNKILTRDTDTR